MSRHFRMLSGVTAVAVLAALMLPLSGVALANHPANSCLDVTPETATNPTNTAHVLTAALKANNATCTGAAVQPTNGAVVINFEIIGANNPDGNSTLTDPDRTCTIQPSGSTCTVSYTGTAVGTDTIRGWIQETGNATNDADAAEGQNEATTPGTVAEPDETDVVTKTWNNPSTSSHLDCSPETATNPVTTSHSIGCTVRDSSDVLVNGAHVDVEATGANDAGDTPLTPDFTCTTDASGTCQITDAGTNATAGTTTYRAWVDADNDNTTNESDATEGRDEATAPGAVAEPDNTDVVQKTWVAGVAAALDCDDAVGPDTEHESNPGTGPTDPTSTETYTCKVTDANDNVPTGTFTVKGEVENAVNDPDTTDAASYDTPDYTCTTAANAACTINVTQFENDLGTATICFWVGTAAEGATLCAANAEATNENAAQDGSDTGNDFADQVEKTWVAVTSASRLDCTPETATNATGTSHTITCTATDNNGSTVANANVDIEATGANDPDTGNTPLTPDFSCTTNNQGTCTITDSGTNAAPGVTTYRAWIDKDFTNSSNEADMTEARDEVATPGTIAEPDGTDVVDKTWLGAPSKLTMTPATDSASVGFCNPFTVTITDSADQGISGVTFDVEQLHAASSNGVVGDEPTVSFCTPATGINPTGVNTAAGDRIESPDNVGTAGGETLVTTNTAGKATFGIAVAPSNGADGTGTVSITAFFETTDNDDPDQADIQDTSTKTWVAAVGRTIDCTPKQSSNKTGTAHVVTCTVKDRFGDPVANQGVTFSETGVGDFTTPTQVNTDSAGTASATTTSLQPGTETITGTITDQTDCVKAANNPAGAPAGICANSVTKTWTQATPSSLQLTPDVSTDPVGSQSTFSALVLDSTGAPVAGAAVTWSEAGEGAFVSSDATTDASGVAHAVVSSTTPGNEGITATSACTTGSTCSDSSVQHWGPDSCDIFGTSGDDVLQGTSASETICGFGGDDTILGGDGDDTIIGGKGADGVEGGAGDDTIKGDAGKDALHGGAGADVLKGGSGDDYEAAGDGDDHLKGGRGDDRMNGGAGHDSCSGGPGRDTTVNCE